MEEQRIPVAAAAAAGFGLLTALLLTAPTLLTGTAEALAATLVGVLASRAFGGGRPWAVLLGQVVATLAAYAVVPRVFVLPTDPVVPLAYLGAYAATTLVRARSRVGAVGTGIATAAVVGWTLVPGAGAWSVDEPSTPTPGMVADDGIDVQVDTHAFLLQQGVAVLRGDGHTGVADFLESADPTAPLRRTQDGQTTQQRESYLWRLQTGARDADRSLKKKYMPDHFFNWWTHAGKGIIAGTSAATWAEQQFAQAVTAWQAGDRSGAMYHLGAAAHLVDDACAPPHASPFVPNHRAFENWVVVHQQSWAVDHAGIYRGDFRVQRGHGGASWSSGHTRGWVDECAHRAVEYIPNAAQAPPDDPASTGSYVGVRHLFEDAQRLTAGYLDFFFTTVGGAA
ncbi:MAG: hypothetical protein JOZ82_09510 [Marmoricola sp.]|nr:hypothetical protein [Marmoricola sp.]